MADKSTTQRLLLSYFADFYEEVARIKLAIRDGALAAYLAGELAATNGDAARPDDETTEGVAAAADNGVDLAAGVSQRLAGRLREQGRRVRECANEEEQRLYRFAQYAMAAHADELFLLELEWPGRDHWHERLLERQLFRTATSGRDFFIYCDRILAARGNPPLMEDLAAVYLTAIQLGFKGQYRGRPQLAEYRRRLLRFIGCAEDQPSEGRAFTQAYTHLVSEAEGTRLRPLSRWYRWAVAGGLLYLVLSSGLWLLSTGRFIAHFGNG